MLVVLALIIYATLDNSWDWFKTEGLSGVLSLDWAPTEGKYGAGALIIMTLMVAAIALMIAVPISVGIALFVTEVAPRQARLPIVFVIDLLAAIPSVVFGLWMLRAARAAARRRLRRRAQRGRAASRSSRTCSATRARRGSRS